MCNKRPKRIRLQKYPYTCKQVLHERGMNITDVKQLCLYNGSEIEGDREHIL